MEQVPVPAPGPNEVLIKLEKTAICGTDLHIYKWDEWSQRTIKPGLVIGHEFVGRIVDIGPGVDGYQIGRPRLGRRPHRLRPLPQLPRRPPPPVPEHRRHRRQPRRRLRRIHRDAGLRTCGRSPPQIPSELAAFFDPYGNAAHCALVIRPASARTC